MIEDLVKEYIKKSQSIIIATISCKDEIENQAIVTLAKEVDPAGRRTLGVLTKPDTIGRGEHASWLKILRGDAHKLSLGYYVVKNPSKSQLDDRISFEDAREDEVKVSSRLLISTVFISIIKIINFIFIYLISIVL